MILCKTNNMQSGTPMITKHLPLFMVFPLLLTSQAVGQEVADQWRYTLRRPADNWHQAEFDDASWTQGFGGFGTRDTPGARVGTTWATNSIWLRKEFLVDSIPAKPALLIHHDEDAEVFINGKRVAVFNGYTVDYKVVPIEKNQRAAIRTGKNLIAVHCRQTGGGQFIDVHVVDADRVPALPKPQRSTKPFLSELITQWGEQVNAQNAWTEYPRPKLRRDKLDQPERSLGLRGHTDRANGNSNRMEWQDSCAVLPGIKTRRRPATARCERGSLVPADIRIESNGFDSNDAEL